MNISGVMKRVCAWKAEVDRQLKKEETVAVRDLERCDCFLNWFKAQPSQTPAAFNMPQGVVP